jgi:hypothetical protein
MYIGNEHLLVGGNSTALTISDFWRWAYSCLSRRTTRKAFAEFLVASSLETIASARNQTNSFDILLPPEQAGIRINVKSGSYTDVLEPKYPNRIQIRLSENDEPSSCDVIVFCIFRAMSHEQSPLDMDLWDFYIISSNVLYRDIPDRRVVTLPSLIELGPVLSDYYGIGIAIQKAMTAI